MVKATRLTVPGSLASDLVPFIDCVPDNKCAEQIARDNMFKHLT
jgi:hypothetical protein